MKKTTYTILIPVLLVIGFFWLIFFGPIIMKSNNLLVNNEAIVYEITYQDEQSDYGIIELSFTESSNKNWYLNLSTNQSIPTEEFLKLAEENPDSNLDFLDEAAWPVVNTPIKVDAEKVKLFKYKKMNEEIPRFWISLTSKPLNSFVEAYYSHKELKVTTANKEASLSPQ